MKIKALLLDETQYYNEKFLKNYGITKIVGVYVFNPEEATHCCELTPSYELWFVHSEPEYDNDSLTDEEKEDLYDEMSEADGCSEPVTYMHCSSVNKLKTIDLGEFENIEEAVEYCQGNWVG